MNEVQKYLTLSGHLFAPYVWVMNKALYENLTPDQRAKFRHLIMPEVKKIIVEKDGPEGEAMRKTLLEVIDTPQNSRGSCRTRKFRHPGESRGPAIARNPGFRLPPE